MDAADIIEQEKDNIIQQWIESVETEIPHSQNYEEPTIMNSVPELLDALIKAIRSRDVSHLATKGAVHGKQRAPFPEYSLRHIIKEYRLLKRTLFSVLDAYPKSNESLERDIVMYVIDEAVEQASEAFYQFRMAEDSSDKEKVENLLIQMKDQDNLRDQFIAALSHDIRNPLNNTLSAVALLENRLSNADDELVHKLLNVIKLSMDKGNALINNLLNVSLIQAGEHLPVYREEGDLLKEIKVSVNSLSPDIQARINIYHSQTQISGYWDIKALCRAIDNLISNALKHGDPKREINIRFKQDDQQTSIEVHNHNNDKPIPEEKQKELFDLYYRDSPGKSRGWGLGLTLVKGIVDAHNGEVKVSSTEEKGTAFILILPNWTEE